MDGRARYAAIHRITKSQTRLSYFPFTFPFHALEKEMATHSSVLAWRIPEMEELPSMGSHRVGHDWSNVAAAGNIWGFPGGIVIKNPPAKVGDTRDSSSIPGWGRSPGGGNGNPLQYSFLENPMDRGARQATAHGVAKSGTWLSTDTKERTTTKKTQAMFESFMLPRTFPPATKRIACRKQILNHRYP